MKFICSLCCLCFICCWFVLFSWSVVFVFAFLRATGLLEIDLCWSVLAFSSTRWPLLPFYHLHTPFQIDAETFPHDSWLSKCWLNCKERKNCLICILIRAPSNVNLKKKTVQLTFAMLLWCITCGNNMYCRITQVYLCVCMWRGQRLGAILLSVPLCSPTAAKLLTGTFQYRDGEHVQYIASHTGTHAVYTHLESLHGFTWRAGAQPAAAANNPSSHFSPGSVLTVHPFTALLVKCASLCVRAGVNVCVSNMVMCQKIKCYSEGGSCNRGSHSSYIMSYNRLHL